MGMSPNCSSKNLVREPSVRVPRALEVVQVVRYESNWVNCSIDRVKESMRVSEFWDGVSSGGKELVVKVYVAAEIAEIQEVGQRGRDDRLSGVDLLLGDSAKHCFELSNQIQGIEGPSAELVLGVDLVESDTA